MPRKVSLYEAKTKLSALVRQVREGGTVVITVHGVPAAELRAIEPAAAKNQTLAERIADLEAQGVITPAKASPREFAKILRDIRKNAKPVPGALKRFLDERD